MHIHFCDIRFATVTDRGAVGNEPGHNTETKAGGTL